MINLKNSAVPFFVFCFFVGAVLVNIFGEYFLFKKIFAPREMYNFLFMLFSHLIHF